MHTLALVLCVAAACGTTTSFRDGIGQAPESPCSADPCGGTLDPKLVGVGLVGAAVLLGVSLVRHHGS